MPEANAPLASDGLDKRTVAARFDRAAATYDEHDVVQREIASRALSRLDYLRVEPARVIDLGSGTGRWARALATRYRRARVVNCDLAPGMLRAARAQAPRWRSRHTFACGDLEALPFADASFDLAFSSLALQWCAPPDRAFAEIRRVLRPGSACLFTTLGPDTLIELREAFASFSDAQHVNRFLDMHDTGDRFSAAGFADPVFETERLTVEYDDVATLLADLRGLGANNANNSRARGLSGRRAMEQLAQAYERFRRNGKLPATYEVVYGHGWAAAPRRSGGEQGGEQVFPLNRLRRRQ